MGKLMNIALWVIQVLFALYFVAGGIFLIGHYKILANTWALNTLPAPVWMALGVLQVVFAIGLVLPGVTGVLPKKLISISAVGLAVISMMGIALYGAYAGSGMLWAVVPAIMLAWVAYERCR